MVVQGETFRVVGEGSVTVCKIRGNPSAIYGGASLTSFVNTDDARTAAAPNAFEVIYTYT